MADLREYKRNWARKSRLENPEKHREAVRKWRLMHPEKTAEMKRKWKLANPEKTAASIRQCHLANPESMRASRRKWRLANPEAKRAHKAVRRAIEQGALVRLPCEICGDPNTHFHHPDYSKPLDGQHLCALDHKQEHRRLDG